MEQTRIVYDKEEDILLLTRGRKVKTSIDIGDFIVDIDMKGFVSAIEILNASDNLKLSEVQLSELKKASMVVTYKPGYVYIYLVMQFKNMEKDITIPLVLDLGHRAVSTEKTNFAVA